MLAAPPRNIPPMTRDRRSVALAGALAVVLAACGGGETASGPDEVAPTTDAGAEAPATTGASAAGPAPSTTSAPAADPDAQAAPDFTLELGTGGEFALSEEAKPVYMVFWAEW